MKCQELSKNLIESASPKLQKLVNKKIQLSEVPEKVKKLFDRGIVASTSFMIGLPKENQTDLRENIELMVKLKSINPFVSGNNYLYFPLPKTILIQKIEQMFNLMITNSIKEYEKSNFWVNNMNDLAGKKFRPWLTDDYFLFLVKFGFVFNDYFQMCNIDLKEESKQILNNNPEINELFSIAKSVNRPKRKYTPYVLDRVLNHEAIDLINDLKKEL